MAVYNQSISPLYEVFVLKKTATCAALVLALAGPQFSPVSAAPPVAQRTPREEREMEDRMQKAANKQRQEDIRKDTQKLFQLASELRDAVDKTNENMLSLDVVKKAEEVEKLAKKVKDKMREGSGRPLKPEPPPVELPRPIGPG